MVHTRFTLADGMLFSVKMECNNSVCEGHAAMS